MMLKYVATALTATVSGCGSNGHGAAERRSGGRVEVKTCGGGKAGLTAEE